MNSMSDGGGMPPVPLHATWPEAQSAIKQENLLVLSVEHWVRANIRPDHVAGTSRIVEAPVSSSKPVDVNCAPPLPVRVPGHTM